MGTLRNILKESKKLNHVLASAGAVGLAIEGREDNGTQPHANGNEASRNTLELAFDNGTKVIRFPSVDALIDFMRKTG